MPQPLRPSAKSFFARVLLSVAITGPAEEPYIATSPNPVSQQTFMRELRTVMRMPIGLPALEWMVRMGAPVFIRTDPELALYGRYLVSRRLREMGFEFLFPELSGALANLLASGHPPS